MGKPNAIVPPAYDRLYSTAKHWQDEAATRKAETDTVLRRNLCRGLLLEFGLEPIIVESLTEVLNTHFLKLENPENPGLVVYFAVQWHTYISYPKGKKYEQREPHLYVRAPWQFQGDGSVYDIWGGPIHGSDQLANALLVEPEFEEVEDTRWRPRDTVEYVKRDLRAELASVLGDFVLEVIRTGVAPLSPSGNTPSETSSGEDRDYAADLQQAAVAFVVNELAQEGE